MVIFKTERFHKVSWIQLSSLAVSKVVPNRSEAGEWGTCGLHHFLINTN